MRLLIDRILRTPAALSFAVTASVIAFAPAAADDETQPRVKPAVPTGEFKTTADHAQELAAWLQRVVGAPFDERARGQPWEEEGKAFVQEAFAHWARRSAYENDGELAGRGRHLRGELKCRDPLVRCLEARLSGRASYDALWHWRGHTDQMDMHSTDIAGAAGEMDAALEELRKIGTPRGFLSAVAMETAWTWNQVNQVPRADETRGRAIEWLREALTDGSYQIPGPEEQVLITNALGEPAWRSTGVWSDGLHLAFEKAPLSEWAKDAFTGGWRYGRALRTRGGGHPDESELLMREAAGYLARSWKLHPLSPEPALLAYWLACNEGMEANGSPQEWFSRVLGGQFDLAAPYHETATAMRPDWAGSVEEMSAFGRACIATHRFDTATPLCFLDIIKIQPEPFDWRAQLRTPENSRALLELAHGMVEEPTRQKELPRWKSLFPVWAWLAGADREAADALAKLKGGLRPIAQQELREFFATQAEMEGELAIRLSPAREDFLKGEELYRQGSVAEAAAAFGAALEKAPDSEAGKKWLLQRQTLAKFEEDYQKGGWVKIPLETGLWQSCAGKWENGADGSLELHGEGRTEHATFRGRVGVAYELRGQYGFHAAKGSPPHFELGIDFRCVGEMNSLSCFTWPTSDRAMEVSFREGIWTPRTSSDMPAIPPDVGTGFESANHFRLITDADHLTFILNQKKIWNRLPTRLFAAGGADERIGFSAHGLGGGNTAAISGLEIRRIAPGVKGPEEEKLKGDH